MASHSVSRRLLGSLLQQQQNLFRSSQYGFTSSLALGSVPTPQAASFARHCISSRSYHDSIDDDDFDIQKTALVVGSSGSLGQTLCKYLANNLNIQVIGADVVEPSSKAKQYLEGGFITMPLPTDESAPSSLPDLTMALVDGLSQMLNGEDGTNLDAIISVAGGWGGDPELPPTHANDLERLEGARQYSMSIERMIGKNL